MPENWDDNWGEMTQPQRTLALIEELWEYVTSEFGGTSAFQSGRPLRRLADRSDEIENMLRTEMKSS